MRPSLKIYRALRRYECDRRPGSARRDTLTLACCAPAIFAVAYCGLAVLNWIAR